MQTPYKWRKFAASVLLGLFVSCTSSMSLAQAAETTPKETSAAQVAEAAAIPSVEETLQRMQQRRLARETAKEDKETAVRSADAGTNGKKSPREMAAEIESLRSDLYSMSTTQAELLSLLDELSEKLAGVEQEQEKTYTAIPAPTNRALVYPASAGRVSYTQDAINSQGDSTMVFTYSPEQLYKVYCRRGYLTDLAFKKGETIQFVGGGDTAGWAVSQTVVDGTPHLYIKPIVEKSTTNLIVTTNRRSYQLILNTSDWYNPMVHWTYGAEDHANALYEAQQEKEKKTGSVAVASVEDLDFSYKVSGNSAAYRPTMVFSDGAKVYLKFQKLPSHQVPLFVQEAGKKNLTLVNYQQKDNYYIVEVPFTKAQLRVSEHETITIQHKK